jgi:hypothetical protein
MRSFRDWLLTRLYKTMRGNGFKTIAATQTESLLALELLFNSLCDYHYYIHTYFACILLLQGVVFPK